MTYEELQRVNETLSTTDIKGKGYVLVNERVKAFRMLYPEGSITTEIIDMHDDIVVMKATISDGEKILATGTAYEREASTFINRTSYIENCETSCVGRAIGFLGLGIDTSIASYEEVQTAITNQNPERITAEEAKQLEADLTEMNVNIPTLLKRKRVKALSELTPKQMMDIYGQIDDYKRK